MKTAAELFGEAKERVTQVTAAETIAKLAADASVVLIDVREDSEWAESHAKGADHLGKGIIERDIEKLVADKDAELILYCGGGYRAVLAADSLQKMGYTNVSSMAGGWRAWVDANAPVDKE